MGVSFGATDILIYVLVPECARKHIRSSLGRNDVCLTFQQLSISGVYFGRRSNKNGYGDDLSLTSFTSMSESVQSDFVQRGEDQQILHHSKVTGETKNGCYNGTHEQNQSYLQNPDLTHSGHVPPEKENAKVVRACMGYIDAAPREDKADLPIRVVRPKIMYIDHNIQAAVDVEDSPMNGRAVFDKEQDQNIEKESTDMIEHSLQSFKEDTMHDKASSAQWDQHHWSEERERIPAHESLIVPEVKHTREESWSIPDELIYTSQENTSHDRDWSHNISPSNENDQKWADSERGKSNKKRTSVLDFSVEDNNVDEDRSWHSQSSSKKSPTGTAQPGIVERGTSTKPKLIPLERSTSKSDNKKMFTSTATFQINMGNKSTNSQKQPVGSVNSEIYKTEAVSSLNMSQPYFENEEVASKTNQLFPRQPERGSNWYEDAAVEDYLYREMIPEPEPQDTQQGYRDEHYFQYKMRPEEETATPRSYPTRTTDGRTWTPLVTPPESFRDATPAGGKLVKVKTGLVDQPRQQPSIVSRDHDNITHNDWEYSNIDSAKLREVPKTVAMTSAGFDSRSADQSSPEYLQYNHGRPVNVNGQPQLSSTFKSESEVLSDYDDSVFTDQEYHDDMSSRFAVVPPPYIPPPEYKKTLRKSDGKFNDDSVSIGTVISVMIFLYTFTL